MTVIAVMHAACCRAAPACPITNKALYESGDATAYGITESKTPFLRAVYFWDLDRVKCFVEQAKVLTGHRGARGSRMHELLSPHAMHAWCRWTSTPSAVAAMAQWSWFCQSLTWCTGILTAHSRCGCAHCLLQGAAHVLMILTPCYGVRTSV